MTAGTEGRVRNVFVGVSTFAVALLYFYALALSVIIALSGIFPWYIVAGAWVVVSAVLYYAKERPGAQHS